MYEAQLLGAVNNMFDVNDRLGVELMGAGTWNGLKKAVTTMSANAIRRAAASQPRQRTYLNASAIKKAIDKAKSAKRVNVRLNGDNDDALCRALWGFNDDYAAELLGAKWYERTWDAIKGGTHKVLEAGENIPVIDAAVSRFRDITGAITGAKSAADVATVAYDNRGKIILIGGGAAILLYLLLRKKGRR